MCTGASSGVGILAPREGGGGAGTHPAAVTGLPGTHEVPVPVCLAHNGGIRAWVSHAPCAAGGA